MKNSEIGRTMQIQQVSTNHGCLAKKAPTGGPEVDKRAASVPPLRHHVQNKWRKWVESAVLSFRSGSDSSLFSFESKTQGGARSMLIPLQRRASGCFSRHSGAQLNLFCSMQVSPSLVEQKVGNRNGATRFVHSFATTSCSDSLQYFSRIDSIIRSSLRKLTCLRSSNDSSNDSLWKGTEYDSSPSRRITALHLLACSPIDLETASAEHDAHTLSRFSTFIALFKNCEAFATLCSQIRALSIIFT